MHPLTFLTALLPFLPFISSAPTTIYPPNLVSIPPDGSPLTDNYIIVLKDTISDTAFTDHQAWAAHIHHRRLTRRSDPSFVGLRTNYSFSTFKAYTGHFAPDTIDQIRNSPDVAFIEENRWMSALSITSQPNVPSWGLARISRQSNQDLGTYYYDTSAGAGVTAYVIDTGINTAHTEFGGRASWGFNNADGTNADLNGHGTHVSGTIAGVTYGVAKKASVVAVKVLDAEGKGKNDNIIEGIQWVVADAKKKGLTGKSVANMSLGGKFSTAINRAVEAAVAAGITFVVAAGNGNVDATNTSPASAGSAITVGSTNMHDMRSTFSNYGRFVDVFAPGTDIKSAWIGSSTAINTISGTSMASPHVAGLAATLVSGQGLAGAGAITPEIFKLAMENRARVANPGQGSNAYLVNNGSGH